jgi:two-component system response regulator YesN
MYKILIADDELLVITSLKACINWTEYGFELIGEANNGIEACEKILHEQPDLVFTDIRMAGMTGLELIKKINDHKLHTLFVVISGYAEFAYAQKAMNYGALGFCLKPFDENEIISVLLKAKSILDRIKAINSAEVFALIDGSSSENIDARNKILKSFGFDSEKGILVILSVGTEMFELDADVKYISFKTGKNSIAYILQNCNYTENKYDLKFAPEGIKGMGISRIKFCFDELGEALQEAGIAAYQYFITGKRGVYTYKNINSMVFEDSIFGLKDAIKNNNYHEADKILNSILMLFEKGEYSINMALKLYNTVMYFLYRSEDGKYECFLSTYNQLVGLFNGIQDMFIYLRSLLREEQRFTPDLPVCEVKNVTFKVILQFVNDNYINDISIQLIAARFSINPSYLSQLFKKETGETFTDYITRLRMHYAADMLKNTNQSVNDISEKSGYNDYFYFTRVFKKVKGMTPTRYRESFQEKPV